MSTATMRRLLTATALLVCVQFGFDRNVVAQEVVLVSQSSPMRYLASTADPALPSDWTVPEFTDDAWAEGTYGIGYDDDDPLAAMLETEIPHSRSVFTRTRFTIGDIDAVESLHLGADYDDAFAAWVNGVEVIRINLPDGALVWDTAPDGGSHESSNGDMASFDAIYDVSAAGLGALVEGENVLAIGAWNVNSTSSDLALVPRLSINRPGPVVGTELCGTLVGTATLTTADSPYTVTCDVTIPKGSTLTIEPGVELYFDPDTSLEVNGQIFALGDEDARIVFRDNGSRWSGVDIDQNDDGDARDSILRWVDFTYGSTLLDVVDTGSSSILVEDCRFDRWSSLALHWDDTDGLVVRRCEFGLDTPLAEANHETINGYRASTLVEYCTFGQRRDYNDVIDLGDTQWGGPVPTVRYNTFLGGDDDAIDFDDSDGWIIGNLVMNHYPRPGASSSANGGGLTGQDSAPVVMNNIVYHCYHGIGYKNDAAPLIVNNLVLDCHVGVTLYKDDCDEPSPTGTLLNNVIWNNHSFDTGAPQNLVLNGRWFDDYCQDAGDQATADVRYNIIEGGWPGEGNRNVDPMIVDPSGGDFALAPDSPALDAGFGGPLTHAGADSAQLAALFAMDREMRPRVDLDCIADAGAGALPYVDLGALETQAPGPCDDGRVRFLRPDSNEDGVVDVSDVVHMLLVLFTGVAGPTCEDRRDANDDGVTDISDPSFLLEFLFRAGPLVPAPYPRSGVDPTADDLSCEE